MMCRSWRSQDEVWFRACRYRDVEVPVPVVDSLGVSDELTSDRFRTVFFRASKTRKIRVEQPEKLDRFEPLMHRLHFQTSLE